tara:strand:- start:2472 stop:3119 length:648 start_codon:yes stop_codon:yes gene_type:complete
MHELTKITLHGGLAKSVGQKSWELSVSSPSEALRAIDIMSKKKLTKAVVENEKLNIKYKILVDDENLFDKDITSTETLLDSAYFINKKYKTIDIIPILEGAGKDGEEKDQFMAIGGAIIFGLGAHWGSPFMMQLGMFAFLTGMSNLLSNPPEHEDFREIQQVNKKESYLFDGAVNTYNPGGPVPVGYGRLRVGSLTIAYSHRHEDRLIYDNGTWV